ncbi:MAG: transposase [Acidobacteria bacterium]|nr:transposase [Acidobacteriota bacterium]
MKAAATNLSRRKYDDEFKQQALLMIRNGQSARSVAHDLGISESLLHKWKQSRRDEQSELEKENEQLRLRLRAVETERDILKKAISIFSRAN